jgi:hypothetical protein
VEARPHYFFAFALDTFPAAETFLALLIFGHTAGTALLVADLVAGADVIDFLFWLVGEPIDGGLDGWFEHSLEGVEGLFFLL